MILSLQCNVYATKTAMSFRLHVFGEIFYFYLENLLNIVGFLRSNYILLPLGLRHFLRNHRKNDSKFKKYLERIPTLINEKILF